MKYLSILLFSLMFFPLAESAQAETDNGEMFVMLTSGDAETQMMALVLTTQSVNQGVNVRVLLCSDAGKLALLNTESPAFRPADRSPADLLRNLINQGVQVEVCGIFLPNREYTEADLIENVSAARPPEVAEFMRKPGLRLFTF